MALTELGAIYAWGTFRNASGVFGFSPTESIAVLPTLVHEPFQAAHQAIKIASGHHKIHMMAHSLLTYQPEYPLFIVKWSVDENKL